MTAAVRGISVENRGGNLNKEGFVEYNATYLVVTDDRSDGPVQVGDAFGIPKLGDQFQVGNDFDGRAVCIAKSVDQGDSPWEWKVEVTWSSDLKEEPKEDISPLDEPPEISYGFQTRRILVPGRFQNPDAPPPSADLDRGIFAPNGELFDPQPEVDLAEPVLTIVKNIADADLDDQELMALANAVNSDDFRGATARQLKMNAPQAVRKWDKEIGYYWTVTYGMAFRWETWDVQLLNQGTYYFDGGVSSSVSPWSTTQARLTKKDDQGNPKVINLTSSGDINDTTTPTYTRLRVFREITFGNLGII